ncbi:Kunitz/Bovine pancreatic trypsin inhibitor domain protein [Oesophagostomum dentatum]|uniref:Kunitz/Bovine pancreatic trypsin inhibitor domain protein n=1 Tax=Oesophagostomum dentatum TaxID=61180 RepID=A0A0B1TH98_OESDE|nr:Kunitz/Bovine pancreatic trypsin inhibitor domain protein [Oesophagostomum dentatum]
MRPLIYTKNLRNLRFWYDNSQQKCVPFIYGGCRGNDNNFETFEQCQEVCERGITPTTPTPGPRPSTDGRLPDPSVCLLSIERGECDKNERRYGYDKHQKRCIEFTYGGCLGNDNNFLYLHDCRLVCENTPYPPETTTPTTPPTKPTWTPPDPAVCLEEKIVGNCTQRIRRYYYNVETQTCEEFIWGGCESSNNNFLSLEDCWRLCRNVRPPTTEPPPPGI